MFFRTRSCTTGTCLPYDAWSFFLRIWRQFISTSSVFKLQDNFITSNSYTCIELNVHNPVLLIKQFRDQNNGELSLPPIFDSQTCEKAFRQFRSMGSMEFTKINFTLYDLLHMISRVEVQNEIAYLSSALKKFFFHTNEVLKQKFIDYLQMMKSKSQSKRPKKRQLRKRNFSE